MTDAALLEPARDISLAGKKYRAVGSFAVLRDIQHEFKQDILEVQARVLDMPLYEFAALLTIAVNSSGQALTEDEVGRLIVDEVDVTSRAYLILKWEAMSWLAMSMTPRADRAKKAEKLDRALEKMIARLASPGENTSKFCFGFLRWGRESFWGSNVWEVADAYDGWAQAHGAKPEDDPARFEGIREDLEEMMRKYPDKKDGE